MSKKTLTLFILSIISLFFISGVVFVTASYARGESSQRTDGSSVTIAPTPSIIGRDNDYTYNPSLENGGNQKPINTDDLTEEEPFVPATEMDLEPSSITVFVNKEFTLPKHYKPDDLVIPAIYFDLTSYDERTLMRSEAAAAIERLFYAASNEGYKLSGVSGYRSYARQKKIFTTNILTKGKVHTLKYSAVPGTSEHQTGLAMDVSCEALNNDLSSKLEDLPEGIWLAENAHRFGFIIRYPEGKSDITGYAFEPWHIRYVGKGLANYLFENELTLEEYYNYVPRADFDFETLYAELINITPSPSPSPSPSAFPIDGEGIIFDENGDIIEGELGEEAEPTPGGKQPSVTPTTIPKDNTIETPTPTFTPTKSPEETSDGDDPTASDPEDSTDHSEEGNLGNDNDLNDLSPTPTPPPTNTNSKASY